MDIVLQEAHRVVEGQNPTKADIVPQMIIKCQDIVYMKNDDVDADSVCKGKC